MATAFGIDYLNEGGFACADREFETIFPFPTTAGCGLALVVFVYIQCGKASSLIVFLYQPRAASENLTLRLRRDRCK